MAEPRAEWDIVRLIGQLAQAVDDRDYDRYRSCFADVVLVRTDENMGASTWSEVASDDYARRALDSVQPFDFTHHQTSNLVIEVTGERARCAADIVVLLGCRTDGGATRTVTLGGRYDLEFARFTAGWRVTRRHRTTRYIVGDTALMDRTGIKSAAKEN